MDYRNFKAFLSSCPDVAIDLETANNLVHLREADCASDEPSVVVVCDGPSDELNGHCEGPGLGYGVISITSPGPVSASKDTWAATEPVQTLGELIIEARTRRGITYEQAASQASLPVYYVKMIEDGNYDAIPDQLYLVPFFRRYAAFLGLDAQEMTARFIHDLEMAENEAGQISVPTTMAARKILVWWPIAVAAFITGVAILLSHTGWSRIGIARMVVPHSAKSSSAIALWPDALPAAARPPMDVALPAAAQKPGQFVRAAAVERPVAIPSARPLMAQRLYASAQHRRRGRHFYSNRSAPVR